MGVWGRGWGWGLGARSLGFWEAGNLGYLGGWECCEAGIRDWSEAL